MMFPIHETIETFGGRSQGSRGAKLFWVGGFEEFVGFGGDGAIDEDGTAGRYRHGNMLEIIEMDAQFSISPLNPL
jgi:hypothetical protein